MLPGCTCSAGSARQRLMSKARACSMWYGRWVGFVVGTAPLPEELPLRWADYGRPVTRNFADVASKLLQTEPALSEEWLMAMPADEALPTAALDAALEAFAASFDEHALLAHIIPHSAHFAAVLQAAHRHGVHWCGWLLALPTLQ